MMTRLLGAGLSAVIALGALLNPGEQPKKADPNDIFDVPAVQAEAPPAPQYQPPADSIDSVHRSLESTVVTKLDELLKGIKEGDKEREQLAERVTALGQTFAEFSVKVEESKVTRDDVVKLVSTTLDEKAAQVKAEFGECECNCDCDAKLAELTKQLEDLKAKVAQLEAAKVAASATSIEPGLPEAEVVRRLQAMGYTKSRTAGSTQNVTTVRQVSSNIVDTRPGHWTHPGDIGSHLNSSQHVSQLQAMGINTAGMSIEQMKTLHDSLHEGTVATAPVQVQMAPPVSNVRTRSRSVSRASSCPGGVCPQRRPAFSFFGW